MRLVLVRNIDAKRVRGLGLADAGNIVVLAFDRHQRNALDGGRIDAAAAMHHLPFRQSVTDEHRIDRLQIELGGQIHDGEIFVIELAVLLRGIAVAFDQMQEQIAGAPRYGGRGSC